MRLLIKLVTINNFVKEIHRVGKWRSRNVHKSIPFTDIRYYHFTNPSGNKRQLTNMQEELETRKHSSTHLSTKAKLVQITLDVGAAGFPATANRTACSSQLATPAKFHHGRLRTERLPDLCVHFVTLGHRVRVHVTSTARRIRLISTKNDLLVSHSLRLFV
jgi:hypothetical protein